ncbi:hypothetical protein [Undibacterium curvum]|uniref:Uncharacterized protein n=1 Tax=Undibacterium curvum TaxID=2762294 RepID=A0ABR7A423_9BURK|nr:hypothetical protein [Undibacterium curvum]MBC3931661.1 hypothetical protein [Undibacterium curvum]
MNDKNPLISPIRLSSENNAASLLGTISENEIQTLLHLRAFPCDLRAGLQKSIAATAQRYAIKPCLVLVGVAVEGGRHV